MKLVTRNGLLLVFAGLLIICEFYELYPSSNEEGSEQSSILVEATFFKKRFYGGGGGYGVTKNQ